MQSRKVLKYVVEKDEIEELNRLISKFAQIDKHAIDGQYVVRSLYFDDPEDTAMYARLNNLPIRELFRMRFYNNDLDYIKLEKKTKNYDFGRKDSTLLTADQVQHIIDGDLEWMKDSADELITEFYQKIKAQNLSPKIVIEYLRYPYVLEEEGIRITLDVEIASNLNPKNFLDEDLEKVPLDNEKAIIEIKWPEDLPEIVKKTVKTDERMSSTFSKYVANRALHDKKIDYKKV